MAEKLTDEQREQFLAIWSETMPEVLTWSDDQIIEGMFAGM